MRTVGDERKVIIIIIIIKNECHSNIIVDRLQGCGTTDNIYQISRDLASVTGSQHGAFNFKVGDLKFTVCFINAVYTADAFEFLCR